MFPAIYLALLGSLYHPAMGSLLGKGPRHTVSSQLTMLMEGAAVQKIQNGRLSENHFYWLWEKAMMQCM